MVRKLFDSFRLPAQRIRETYKEFDLGKAVGKLNDLIGDFTQIVGNASLWPRINPSNDSLILDARHQKLLEDLNAMHVGDESSVLFVRSGRALGYWDLFVKYLARRDDTAAANAILAQTAFDKGNAPSWNASETSLADALTGIATVKKKEVAKVVDSKEAVADFEELKNRINNSAEPAFLLGKAVGELQKIKSKLNPGTDKNQIAAINAYLKNVDKWKEKRSFKYKLESVPEMGHLHIDVVAKGENPDWSVRTQMLEGDEFELEWKVGDHIYIAFDTLKSEENWGKTSSDKVLFKSEYSLFDMEGNITFSNLDKTIIISFNPGLKEQLPKLK